MNTMINPESELLYTSVYTLESDHSVENVVERLPKLLPDHKFSLLNHIDFQTLLESKGFPISRKAHVFEICQAKMAAEMLTWHPLFANFMPCRIAVFSYEDKSVISTMNMEPLIESLVEQQDMYEMATGLFSEIKKVMKEVAS